MTEGLATRHSDKYWASHKVAELLPLAVQKVKDHERFLTTSGLFKVMWKSAEMAQGGLRFHELMKGGKRGQYDLVRINDFGNIFGHTHIGICGQRPDFQPRAKNGDFASQAETKVCDGLLEFYCKEKHGEQRQIEAIEDMLLAGEGFRFLRWDPDAGKMVDVKGKRPIYEGDIRDDVIHPVDVIRDWTRKRWHGTKWVIIRTRENRFDLAALYGQDQEKREAILKAEPERNTTFDGKEIRLLKQSSLTHSQAESDEIDVYHLVHERTPSVPFGRWVTFLDAKTSLEDETFDDRGIDKLEDVVLRCAAAEIKNVPAGYSFLFDLLALQQAVNIAESIALTSLNKFGMQHLSAPAGAIISTRDIGEGLTIFEIEGVEEGEVKGINLMALPEVVLKLADRWRKAMEVISGVNSVRRGDPETSLKSGSALALVEAQFLTFTAGGQRAYAHLWEAYGSGLVKIFRHNVPEPRMAALVGKGSSAYVKEISGQDLQGIDRVTVDMATYLSRTPAGRREMATELLNAQQIDGEEYMHVHKTGELNSILHRRTVEPMYIQRENEHILDPDKPVPTVIDDDTHDLHLERHNELLFNPEVRDDPQKLILARVLDHMTQHKTAIARLTMAAAAIPGATPPAPGGDPNADPNAPESGSPMAPAGEGAGMPPAEQVALPTINPATGKPASVRMPQPTDAMGAM